MKRLRPSSRIHHNRLTVFEIQELFNWIYGRGEISGRRVNALYLKFLGMEPREVDLLPEEIA